MRYAAMVGERHTYRMDLAYDGSRYAGYQQQVSQVTVESTLLRALQPYIPDLRRVAVAGRTDKGVHAEGQVVSFWARRALPLSELSASIEALAEGAITVLGAHGVPRAFHASFSARARSYEYRLAAEGLDVAHLDALMRALQGRRCFHAFARGTPIGQDTIRQLRRVRAIADGRGGVRFELVADRFLRRQIRVIVATAIREMNDGASCSALLELSERGDRTATAPPADPDGLYLVSVSY